MLWKRRRKFLRRQEQDAPCQHPHGPQRNGYGSARRCQECESRRRCSLREVAPGQRAVVQGFLDSMPANRRTQLLAYGLLPGQEVGVRQQYPVTVIQIDCTELALEWDLAEAVQVRL